MALLKSQTETKRGAIRGRESRNQTLTTKLTVAERLAVEAAAKADAKTLGEWLRDVALSSATATCDDGWQLLVLAEVIGAHP
jgi:uncharacterized protein (DUF1778 family)